MIIPYKMTCFYPATSSHGVSGYLSKLSFALLFSFWQEKTVDMKHFPIFLIFDKPCEGKSRRGGGPTFFFLPCNYQPTKITACLCCRDHLSLRGLNSSSTLFETPQTGAAKGHKKKRRKMQDCLDALEDVKQSATYYPNLLPVLFCRYYTQVGTEDAPFAR